MLDYMEMIGHNDSFIKFAMDAAKKENLIFSGNAKVDGIYHTVEWLITAFAGTLVFIIFVMQVYRIPTGSMAETLRGAHFRIRCTQCGWRFDHDFLSRMYGVSETVTPSQKLPIWPRSPVCPSCGFSEKNPERANNGRFYVYDNNKFIPAKMHTVFKGDQIFVIKSIYQFFKPKRWDVIVFKNPLEPRINYIKRCVGLPGETLQLIDGDIFIDGQIARKPDKVQDELWMLIYNNDHRPARPNEAVFFGQQWHQPFQNLEGSSWDTQPENGTVFELSAQGKDIHRIQYTDQFGTDFHATYAYDDPAGFRNMPLSSDIMVQFYPSIKQDSSCGAQIRKYGMVFEGWLNADGKLSILKIGQSGQAEIAAEGKADPADMKKLTRFRMAAIDQQIVLQYGAEKLVYDLGTGIKLDGADRQSTPAVQIAGNGQVRLSHIALYRDIHYTLVDMIGRPILRATPENPMVLGKEEFFACGDNSPASADSRFWDSLGKANRGKEPYTAGVVPMDYLVGKAFFVHWPGAYRFGTEPIRWIPFVDGMKPIYGGKE